MKRDRDRDAVYRVLEERETGTEAEIEALAAG